MKKIFLLALITCLSPLLICCCTEDDRSNAPQTKILGPYGKDLSKPDISMDSLPKEWIKPMWPKMSTSPKMDIFDTCGAGESDGQKGFSPVPVGVMAILLETPSNYTATVRILDKDSVVIKEFVQQFGFCGELANINRQSATGYISFIGWDGKTNTGTETQDGVMVWTIGLNLKDGSWITKVISVEHKR
jgi:hypothetical protein